MAFVGTLINIILWSAWLFRVVKVFFKKNSYNNFLLISAFLMPFYSASFGILGFQLSVYKIMPIFLLLTFLLSKERLSPKILAIAIYFSSVFIIFYYLAVDSNLFQNIINLGRSEFSAYYGPIVQGIFFMMVLFQLWLLRKKTRIDHIKILSYYVYGCIILAMIGYMQILFYILGLPWFDFWFLNDAMGRSIDGGLATHALDQGFYRMSSLGGEPRHFSAILALSLMLKQYLKTTGIKIPYITSKKSYLTTIFLLSGMFFSFSSSGLLSLLIGAGIYLYFTETKRALIITFLILVGLILFANYSIVGNILWKLSSIDIMLYAVKKDAFALSAITHNWLHFIFGYGMNLADLYVPDYYLLQETPFGLDNRYLKDNPMESTISPTSAILQIFVNGGVFGSLLLLLLAYREMHKCRRTTKIFIFAVLGMVSVSSTLIFSMAVFFFAIIIAYEKIAYA